MQIIEDIFQATQVFPRLALTIGSFDGVHLGHQRILDELVRAARVLSGTAAVMTMRPHPRELFSPNHPPNLLTADSKKLDLFRQFGVDVAFILPFTPEVAHMPPEDFVRRVIRDRCHVEKVIIGHDFCFGRDAAGDYAFLLTMAAECGYDVTQVAPLFIEGERVSSTAIRECVLEGDLDRAEIFLGRKYSIVGEVVGGRGIGAQLGFPTANVKPYHTAVPAHGVYAAEVILGNQTYAAAVNIGIAPTIQHEDMVIEAHVLDFHEFIRGREIELVFHKRLRPEKKFGSHEELMAAIALDVDGIRRYFSDRRLNSGTE